MTTLRLVLCNPDDLSALWAGQGLRARGGTPVRILSPVQLICARRLEYRAESGEPAQASAELDDGKLIDARQLSGVLNRAARIDYPQVRRAAPADRNYVRAEMDATLLAWLGALPAPIFNPPHTSGWGGAYLHPFDWAIRAQTAGFLTLPHRSGYNGLELPIVQNHHTTSHLIFGGRTFPALSPDIEKAAVQLAQTAAIPLLGITLAWTPEGRTLFIYATPMPDLQIGGAPFLDALAAAFTTP